MAPKKQAKDRIPTKQLYLNQVVGDSSQSWPKSMVHDSAKIRKEEGCKKYALEPKEIEDLKFEEEKWRDWATGEPRRSFLYCEKDLEQKARAKYDSPKSLERARRRQDLRKGQTAPQSSFSQSSPAYTMPSSGNLSQRKGQRIPLSSSQAPLALASTSFSSSSTPPSGTFSKATDSGVGGSDYEVDMHQIDTLEDMEAYLNNIGQGWLWERLNATFEDTFGPEAMVLQLRRKVILAAQGPFLSGYPIRRCRKSTQPTKSLSNLYKIMDDALESVNHTKTLVGGVTMEVCSKADWTQDYHDRVYRALFRITKHYGPKGWKQARWVVYDKYVECKCGSLYVIMKRGPPNGLGIWEWGDDAAFWLHQEEYKMGPFLKGRFLKLFDEK